jgi:hypothetical protein
VRDSDARRVEAGAAAADHEKVIGLHAGKSGLQSKWARKTRSTGS